MYSPRNRSSVSGSVVRRRATAARTRASISSRRRRTWISDGSATAVRPGADIGSGAVDAANAQDAAGLLLFPGANQLFLVGRDAGLFSPRAWLEPPGGLRSTGSGRAHRLGTLGGGRPALGPPPSRRGCRPFFGLTIGSREGESRLFEDRRTCRNGHLDLERRIDDEVERCLELAAQRRPDV